MLAKVRQALGFARCQKSFYGAAPMTADTQHFFLGLNIRLYSGYGLSETSGPHFMSSPRNYRLYRCGVLWHPRSHSLGYWTLGSPSADRSILGHIPRQACLWRWCVPLCHPGLWLKAAIRPSTPEQRDSPLSLSRGRAEGVPAPLMDQTPRGVAAQGQPSVGQGGPAGLGVS